MFGIYMIIYFGIIIVVNDDISIINVKCLYAKDWICYCVSSLPMTKMTNTDLSRLLKSDEIQKALRPPK